MCQRVGRAVEDGAERLPVKFLEPAAKPGDAPLAGGLAVMGHVEPFGTQDAGAGPAVLLEDADAFEQVAVADHERDPARLIPEVDLAESGTGVGPEPRNGQLPELLDAPGGGWPEFQPGTNAERNERPTRQQRLPVKLSPGHRRLPKQDLDRQIGGGISLFTEVVHERRVTFLEVERTLGV
jgi:hypothetical protein